MLVYTPKMKLKVISNQPDVMGGAAVFIGTRVPVQTLIDYLQAGDNIDDFLKDFPSVKREQVLEYLEAMKQQLLTA